MWYVSMRAFSLFCRRTLTYDNVIFQLVRLCHNVLQTIKSNKITYSLRNLWGFFPGYSQYSPGERPPQHDQIWIAQYLIIHNIYNTQYCSLLFYVLNFCKIKITVFDIIYVFLKNISSTFWRQTRKVNIINRISL